MKPFSLVTLALISLGGVCPAQDFSFHTAVGEGVAAQSGLNGFGIADSWNGSTGTGYSGELGLIFSNQNDLPGGIGVPRGTFLGQAGSAYAGRLGLVAFCVDFATDFRNSSGTASASTYRPYTAAAAETRYLAESSSGYLGGGLLKAAYLIERFYDESRAGTDVTGAALQAAIWDVLTDGAASLSDTSSNYFVNTNSGNGTLNTRSTNLVGITNGWYATAAAEDWGGPNYDPGDRVVFWLDPTNIHLNQAVATLNLDAFAVQLVPEPGTSLMVLLAGGLLCLRRRR